MSQRTFASDNNSGVHPTVLQSIAEANVGHVKAYGDDPITQKAIQKFKDFFGKQAEVFFVYGGTGANVLGLKALTESYHSVICSEGAHIYQDECGAPEKFTGCKLVTIPTPDGKITVDQIQEQMVGIDFEHHVQPRVVSITQATEVGTVYTPQEIKKIAEFAHANRMYLHVDGARIANACASLGITPKEMITDTCVDVLSFGGTKNGMMFGEAIVFFNPDHAKNFKYIRKQSMQLSSKMRFISAQFDALLTNDLWLQNARHANEMAKYLESKIREIPEIKITQKVEANGVFAILPEKIIPVLQEHCFFYVWNEKTNEVRWMCSFDTQKEDIDAFASEISNLLQKP